MPYSPDGDYSMHPFRFIAAMPVLGRSRADWRERLVRIEDLGYSSVAVSDHLTGGWSMEPLIALTSAADATTGLRLLSLVLSNDFRHPVIVHRAIAMLDVLSDGRVELGLGAGWMASDYSSAGIAFDDASKRIERLEEALLIYKQLCNPEPVTFEGVHYQLDEMVGLPVPVQHPHPPLLVGGGGPRMLRLAARHADIVGVHCRLPAGTLDERAVEDLRPERITEKVATVRNELQRCGRKEDDVELQFTIYSLDIVSSGNSAIVRKSRFAQLLADVGADDSPAVVQGTVNQCAEKLHAIRERFGFSYFKLGGDPLAAAPLVAKLAGT